NRRMLLIKLQQAIWCLEDLAPAFEFGGERSVKLALAVLVRVIPKAIVTMPAINPARMIEYGIETDAVQRNTGKNRGLCFVADIAQPARTRAIFCAGFGDKHGAMVTLEYLAEHLTERTVERMLAAQRRELANASKPFEIIIPLVLGVEIDADNIQISLMAAQFRPQTPTQHVPGLELGNAIRL